MARSIVMRTQAAIATDYSRPERIDILPDALIFIKSTRGFAMSVNSDHDLLRLVNNAEGTIPSSKLLTLCKWARYVTKDSPSRAHPVAKQLAVLFIALARDIPTSGDRHLVSQFAHKNTLHEDLTIAQHLAHRLAQTTPQPNNGHCVLELILQQQTHRAFTFNDTIDWTGLCLDLQQWSFKTSTQTNPDTDFTSSQAIYRCFYKHLKLLPKTLEMSGQDYQSLADHLDKILIEET